MKERIITGSIMALIVIMIIFYLKTTWFTLIFFLITIVGAFEWTKLMSFNLRQSLLFIIVYISITGLQLLFRIELKILIYLLLSISTLFWISMPIMLRMHTKTPLVFLTHTIPLCIISILTLNAFLISMMILHFYAPMYVFLLILLVATADSMAYFVGRKIGKNKLAPTISPGKSIEGACAGIISSLIVGLIAAFFLKLNGLQSTGFMLLCGIMVVVSISGDLFESLVKRHAGAKDSGNILPGHGGILDRIDALTAAAPLFLGGLFILEIF